MQCRGTWDIIMSLKLYMSRYFRYWNSCLCSWGRDTYPPQSSVKTRKSCFVLGLQLCSFWIMPILATEIHPHCMGWGIVWIAGVYDQFPVFSTLLQTRIKFTLFPLEDEKFTSIKTVKWFNVRNFTLKRLRLQNAGNSNQKLEKGKMQTNKCGSTPMTNCKMIWISYFFEM